MTEKWYWIELIGFDNTLPDYGAESFLSRALYDVRGISLLFSDIDFILNFSPDDAPLRPCDCSYGGHPASEERERQVWTKSQLKGLVRALRERGVTVLVSFFDFFSPSALPGEEGKFTLLHPEIGCLNAEGKPAPIVNMLKRLSDGSYFADYLVKKLHEVMDFYGFDGVQVADGISTFRQAVQNGDMSDDLVEQFVRHNDFSDPELHLACDGNQSAYRKRRKYIIEYRQNEWLAFCAQAWSRVYDTFYVEFDGSGKILLFNSCWTRDPFEAYVRFGFDYRLALKDKAYALMVEEVSATAPIFSDEDRGGFYLSDREKPQYHYEYYLMQQSIKACMPQLKQITLTPIRDTCEQWDLMRHSPTEQERAICRRNNSYVFDGERFVNGSSGPHYCLSDSMRKADWEYLSRKERDSSPVRIERPLGFEYVFSADSLRSETAYYLKTNRYSQTALKNRLIAEGLCIDGAVNAVHAIKTTNPLLILNPAFWSKEERDAVDGSLTNAVVIGEQNPFTQSAAKTLHCGYLSVWLYGRAYENVCDDLFAAVKCADKRYLPTPYLRRKGVWGMPLQYEELPRKFFALLATELNRATNMPVVISARNTCVITTFKVSQNKYRMLISNNAYHYYIAKIRCPFRPVQAKSALKYDGYTVYIENDCFYDRIPPRGMDIVEIETGGEEL